MLLVLLVLILYVLCVVIRPAQKAHQPRSTAQHRRNASNDIIDVIDVKLTLRGIAEACGMQYGWFLTLDIEIYVESTLKSEERVQEGDLPDVSTGCSI